MIDLCNGLLIRDCTSGQPDGLDGWFHGRQRQNMTRDFIFDSTGAVIGYRCLTGDTLGQHPWCGKLFQSARGLRQHQQRAHGLYEQAKFELRDDLECALSTSNLTKLKQQSPEPRFRVGNRLEANQK
jgi:hypothetical protein